MTDTYTIAHIPDEAIHAALLSMAQDNIGADVQGLLMHGFDKLNAKPNALRNALAAALPHLSAPCAVEVMKLEWEAVNEGGKDRKSKCELGEYIISVDSAFAGSTHYLWIAGQHEDSDPHYEFRTMHEAKAAAQADFERRTLANIVTKPVDVAAIREQCAQIAEDFRDKHWIAHDIKIGIFPNRSEAGIAIADAIRALSPAEPAQTEQWQPIETAPMDGSSVVVYDSFVKGRDGFERVIARFDKDHGWHVSASVVGGIYIRLTNPIKWMPLPAAPSTEAGK